jgi:hypothetical protein
MKEQEFILINRLASQLQHFHDQDGLQGSPAEVAILLEEAHKAVTEAQPDVIKQLCMDKFADKIATRDQGND